LIVNWQKFVTDVISFIFWLVAIVPYLIVIGLIVWIIRVVMNKRKRSVPPQA